MFKKSSKGQSWVEDEAFKTIEDLPVYNWDKISRTGDLKFLLRNSFKDELKAHEVERLSEIWDDLQQQYLDEFGLPMGYKINLRKRRKIAKLMAKWAITGDNRHYTMAGYLIKQMQVTASQRHKGQKLHELAILVSNANPGIGRINTKEWSVLDFYTALRLAEKKANDKDR